MLVNALGYGVHSPRAEGYRSLRKTEVELRLNKGIKLVELPSTHHQEVSGGAELNVLPSVEGLGDLRCGLLVEHHVQITHSISIGGFNQTFVAEHGQLSGPKVAYELVA